MEIQDIDFLGGVHQFFGESRLQADQYSALGLAYIGDGVYDLIVRTIIMDQGNGKVKDFHRRAISIVKAESQARLVKSILDQLTEKEDMIYRHGRNAKSATSAKNASIIDYRVATGFEALIGYLYLNHELERAMELIQIGFERTGQLCIK